MILKSDFKDMFVLIM